MKAYHNTAVLKFDDSTTGNAASGATVTVRINSTQGLAGMFNLADVAIANPMNTDSNGNYAFKVDDNIYDIIISEGTANEVKLEKVEISVSAINSVSVTYSFPTVALYKVSTILFPVTKRVYLADRNGYFNVIAGTTLANTRNIIASTSVDQSIDLIIKDEVIAFQFGIDITGVIAADAAINAAFIYAMENKIQNLTIPAGFITCENDLNFIQNGSVLADTARVDIKCAGRYSTIFCSRGAPFGVVKIDGRFVTMRGFSIWGSIDEIRDSTNSAEIGLNIVDMRVGAVSDFMIAHVVGAGIKIQECIISHFDDGVISRCGSDTHYAMEQTLSEIDGFQASSFTNVDIEDSHGSQGAMSWKSHRNSEIANINIEQQPYYIAELSSPSGQFVRGEAVTFTGGATGVVGLTSTQATDYINSGRGQIVVESLVGTLATATGTVSTGSGSGTVTAVTKSGGRQFTTDGEYGKFDGIWLNQNELRETGEEFRVTGDDNHFGLVKIRDKHYGNPVHIVSNRNTFDNLDIEQQVVNIADHALFDESLKITGNGNTFKEVRLFNSKGLVETGGRNTISVLKTRELYGQAADIQGDHSEILDIDTLMATYVDSGELDDPHVRLAGLSSKLKGGTINAPLSGTDVVQLSGISSSVDSVHILDCGSATSGIRTATSGVGAKASNCDVKGVNSGSNAINLTAQNSKAIDNYTNSGLVGVKSVAAGSVIRGNECEGYVGKAVSVEPGSVIEGVRVESNDFHDAAGGTNDIEINSNVTYSHIINNNGRRGHNSNTLGAGTGNVLDNNI
jgi:hypothetical protein